FLARDLVDTTAWLRWGMPGAQPLLVLALGIATAIVTVSATGWQSKWSRRTAFAGTGLLTILVLLFGIPLDLPIRRTQLYGGFGAPPAVTVLDAGATIRVENELPTTELWGQLENRGAELETS